MIGHSYLFRMKRFRARFQSFWTQEKRCRAHHTSRVPHFSRTLREVGFHNPQPSPPLLVWNGHSCPLPLTLIVILVRSGRRLPHFSRTLREVGFHNSQPHGISIPPKIAPQVQRWKSGASAPRNAHTIRNRASALVDFGCKHFLIARPAGKRKARPCKPPHGSGGFVSKARGS